MFYQHIFYSLSENMPFPMAVFFSDWKILKMNQAFEEISGNTKTFDYLSWKEQALTPVDAQKFQLEINGQLKYYILKEQEILDCFGNISGYSLIMQEVQ